MANILICQIYPRDLLTTVTAWTVGEETFLDTNGNKIFDDDDIGSVFFDIEEPYVDIIRDGVFNDGDTLIDVVNGNDLTGTNGVHDIGDTFLNSPNCTHSSLCSSVAPTTFIWVDMDLFMLKPAHQKTRPQQSPNISAMLCGLASTKSAGRFFYAQTKQYLPDRLNGHRQNNCRPPAVAQAKDGLLRQ